LEKQEYLTDTHKLYEDIAKGFIEIDSHNFEQIRELIPSNDSLFETKRKFSYNLLEYLKIIDSNFVFSQQDYNKFDESPQRLNLKLLPNTPFFNAFNKSKELMQLVNYLYGNYVVSYKTMLFLIKANQRIIKTNKELLKKYEELLESRKVLEDLKVEEFVGKKQEVVLDFTQEEKQDLDEDYVEESEENVEEGGVEKNDN
jgi:hypothetical protein